MTIHELDARGWGAPDVLGSGVLGAYIDAAGQAGQFRNARLRVTGKVSASVWKFDTVGVCAVRALAPVSAFRGSHSAWRGR